MTDPSKGLVSAFGTWPLLLSKRHVPAVSSGSFQWHLLHGGHSGKQRFAFRLPLSTRYPREPRLLPRSLQSGQDCKRPSLRSFLFPALAPPVARALILQHTLYTVQVVLIWRQTRPSSHVPSTITFSLAPYSHVSGEKEFLLFQSTSLHFETT